MGHGWNQVVKGSVLGGVSTRAFCLEEAGRNDEQRSGRNLVSLPARSLVGPSFFVSEHILFSRANINVPIFELFRTRRT